MKKLLIALLPLAFLFISCDDFPNDVIDTEEVDYQLNSVNAPNNFVYTGQDSILTTTLSFDNTKTISSVWFNIVTGDGSATLKQKLPMNDDGVSTGDVTPDDGVYTGKATLGSGIAAGKYVLEFYVEDNVTAGENKIQKVASHNFNFTTSEDNVAPVLSNLAFVDTVARDEQFVFSIEAEDKNGYSDIDRVYYEVFDPDGNQLSNSQGITKFPMFDDGETGGDENKQDGIFTVALTFPASFATGDYSFELTAEDNFGALSNTITHTLTVK